MGDSGVPKGRPVCGATITMNQRMSDLLSDILAGVASSNASSTCEASSTEDFLSKIEEFNEGIRRGEISSEDLNLGSLDVSALFPSIEAVKSAKICIDAYVDSPMEV